MNLCKGSYNVRQRERKELAVHNKQWKLPVAERRSRGKLATGLGARGFEHKINGIHAASKISTSRRQWWKTAECRTDTEPLREFLPIQGRKREERTSAMRQVMEDDGR